MFLSKPMLGTQIDRSDSLNNPVLDLLMNEGHGDRVDDLSGWGNHGTLHGFDFPPTKTSGWNPGHDGHTLNYAVAYNYIDCGNNPILNPIGAITVEVVMTPLGVHQSYRYILNKREDTKGYYLMSEKNTDDWLSFIVKIGGVSRIARTNNYPAIGIPSRIIGTYDGQRVRVYMNGIEQTYGTNITGNIDATTAHFHVGAYDAENSSNVSISTVRILLRAMSAFEVMQTQIDPWGVYQQ